ncbi:formate dehydrogenase major subunit [Halogranum gelatinilyticum]|uniref:Formate dehydrogenase major subunit n=1 Tax=Halogranum gelatinilyticum TaxID=660521 RepID=A0A1G9U4F0_9EURY|nr:formate dehydrogenase subunit alpha [Halogranum gelatinilyticum]SDM54771.1 formate dehydrogenase major subunit [Halogranum gelatinilyticum]
MSPPTPRESVCPFCGVGCGIQYNPTNGKAVGWHGAVNTRGEVCPKGVAAFDVVGHEDRLTRPLVRGDDGQLHEATWDEALLRVETAFGEIVAEHGPDALAFFASSNCTNEENYVFQKLARLLGTNNVDNCARLCHASTVAAMSDRLGAGAMTNSLTDLRDHADCFLVVGANPAEQHPIVFRSYVLPALARGATLIHVDPRENATTDAADLHLPVRPGYDIPLLNAMAKVVVEEGLVDRDFLTERVTGDEDFRAFLDGVDVDREAGRAGVDPDLVREAARTYAGAGNATTFTGMGMSQHHYGTDNVHALVNLALLTGNLGKPGAGVNPLRGQNNVQGAGDVGALPNLLPGYADVTDDAARARVADEWGVDADDLPALPGLTEVETTHAFGDSVHGAFVFGENPLVTEPNLARVREGFANLDCLVVLDIFPTETAELADVVLPGSAWAEKDGTVTNTDRQVQRMRPNADLPGDARRDLDILCDLGRRLTGREDQFGCDGPEAVFAELTRVTPQYAGMSYDGIGTGSQRWPFPEGASEGTAVLHVDEFASGSKTAKLRPVVHVDPADSVADDELVLTTGRVLQQFNSGAVTRRSGMLTRLRGSDVLQIHPDDAGSRGIADGDRVVVENDRGTVTVAAEVTPAIRPGVVFATFHYAEPLINDLTGDALDPVAKIPEFKHSAVRVRVADDV